MTGVLAKRHALKPKALQVTAAWAPGTVGRRARTVLRWRTYCGRCPYIARSRHATVRRAMVRVHRRGGCPVGRIDGLAFMVADGVTVLDDLVHG